MQPPDRLLRPVAAALGATLLGGAAVLGSATAATAATASVSVRDFEYAPATVEIVAGDTVQWTWGGESRHSVTAPGVFDSHPDCSILTPDACGAAGATFSWTSSEPGTIEYGCKLHADRMRGTITVVAAAEPSPAPSSPAPASPAPASPRPSSPPPSSPPPPPPSPAASPTASPSPSASPSPRPTRRSAPSLGFGQATEVPGSPLPTEGGSDVAPPLVSDVSPEPLEPFPAAPSPSESPAPVAGDVVAAPPGGSDERVVRLAGVAAVALTTLAFGRVVLFGRPWE